MNHKQIELPIENEQVDWFFAFFLRRSQGDTPQTLHCVYNQILKGLPTASLVLLLEQPWNCGKPRGFQVIWVK